MLQKDLLLNPANSTEFVPTWHGASSQVNQTVKQVYTKQTPIKFTKQQPNIFIRPRSQDNTLGEQFAPIYQHLGPEIKQKYDTRTTRHIGYTVVNKDQLPE